MAVLKDFTAKLVKVYADSLTIKAMNLLQWADIMINLFRELGLNIPIKSGINLVDSVSRIKLDFVYRIIIICKVDEEIKR